MKFYLAIYQSGSIKIADEFFNTKEECLTYFQEYKMKYPCRWGSFEIYDTETKKEIYHELF